jgi:cupin 2 domain-containing protein
VIETTGNLFQNLPETLESEYLLDLVQSGDVRIERVVSPASMGPTAWYCQDWPEWVMVARGRAALLFEGDAVPRQLRAGDYLFIPAGRRHRVEWTGAEEPTIWLAVHFPAA